MQRTEVQLPAMPPAPGAPEAPKPRRGRKIVLGIVVGLTLLGVGGAIAGGTTETPAPAPISEPITDTIDETAETIEDAAKKTEPTEPEFTAGQENAISSAESYLDYSAFSKSGLIDQLKFERYSAADARFAVNHITVDWNEQAAKSAQSNLEYSSFSRQGLIDQLEYEGFTTQQATYGVNTTGL